MCVVVDFRLSTVCTGLLFRQNLRKVAVDGRVEKQNILPHQRAWLETRKSANWFHRRSTRREIQSLQFDTATFNAQNSLFPTGER